MPNHSSTHAPRAGQSAAHVGTVHARLSAAACQAQRPAHSPPCGSWAAARQSGQPSAAPRPGPQTNPPAERQRGQAAPTAVSARRTACRNGCGDTSNPAAARVQAPRRGGGDGQQQGLLSVCPHACSTKRAIHPAAASSQHQETPPHLQLADVPLVEAQRARGLGVRDAQQVNHLGAGRAVSVGFSDQQKKTASEMHSRSTTWGRAREGSISSGVGVLR